MNEAHVHCRLLIFEGIMGAGKSTSTRRFGERIADAGIEVEAFTEARDPHPVRASDDLPNFFKPWLHVSAQELAYQTRKKWARYVELRLLDGVYTVMDGQLFHGDLTNLLMMEMPFNDIQVHVNDLQRILEPLAPLVVYFHQADIERAIHRVCEERGERWVDYQLGWKLSSPFAIRLGLTGVAGLVSLYKSYRDLTDSLFKALECRKLALETSQRDWPDYETRIIEQLRKAQVGM